MTRLRRRLGGRMVRPEGHVDNDPAYELMIGVVLRAQKDLALPVRPLLSRVMTCPTEAEKAEAEQFIGWIQKEFPLKKEREYE